MPFDVDKHRATPFKINDKSDKSGKNELTKVLTTAIKSIIEKSPLKPHERKSVNPEDRKRQLDIENLEKLLSTIHIPTFDYFLDEAPDYIFGDIFHYFEGYKSIMRSNTFHIYNQEILNLLQKIYDNWQTLLSYGHRYDNTGSLKMYKFFFPNDQVGGAEAQQDLLMLFEIKVALTENFKELLKNIRENYLEIDLSELSKKALDEFVKFRDGEK